MADSTVAALSDGSPAQATDYIYAVRSPYTSGTDIRLSLQDVVTLALADLTSPVLLKGAWDASAGTFPGGGNAAAGWTYIVSVGGTVDGVAFSIGDRLLAVADSASTTVYAANWLKLDYTDQVLSVDGATGAVDLSGSYQPKDATLTALAGVTTAADKLIYATDADTFATTDLTAFARSILDDADEATFKATVNLEIGTDVQAYDAGLADIAALAVTDGNIIVGNGTNWVAESGSTARTSLGLGTGDSPQFTNETLTGYLDLTEISAPSAPSAGILRLWSEDNNGISVLHFKSDIGVDHQLGRDLLAVVRNDTGSTLTTGQVVYVSGSNGTTPRVALARSNSASTMPALGVVVADIATNGFGQICFAGDVRGLDTSAWAAGDVLYVDPTTAGALTNTPPTGTNIPQRVGIVVTSNLSQGIINVIIGAEINPALTQTISNKSISLTSNAVTGTMAEFDTAASDGNFLWESDVGVSVQAYAANLDSWSAVAPSDYTTVANLAATTTGNGSALVGIEDAGSYFSGTTVESALQYLGSAVAALDQAVVLKGTWDASAGTFPGAGAAQAGWSYIVSVDGTVDSVDFVAGDRIVAITDNASTATYASNWLKLDYTDRVSSVAGRTGAVTLAQADVSGLTTADSPQFAEVNIGHASDTTLTRVSAGVAAIEGSNILLASDIGTDVQAYDGDLASLAANTTNGLWARTGDGTGAARTITGTANQITVTNGDGVSGNPTLSLPADVAIPTVVTVPNTGLHLLDTNATHDLIVAPGSNLTADRTLTVTTGDANRTLNIGAWTSWTPTISSGGGTVTGATITTTAYYCVRGATVDWLINCTITGVGSGAPTGAVKFTVPSGYTPSRANNPAVGYYVNAGAVATGNISSDGYAYAFKADGTTFWSNGNVFVLSGTYQL